MRNYAYIQTYNNNNNNNIRWIIDDCMTFLQREVKRGNKYEGIILDPPAFGRGIRSNQRWKLDEDLIDLINIIPDLLSENPLFVLLTCHDTNWSGSRLSMLLNQVLGHLDGSIEYGNMEVKPLQSNTITNSNSNTSLGDMDNIDIDIDIDKKSNKKKLGNALPLGIYVRWTSNKK